MTAETMLSGRCLCGACTFTLRGAPNWVGHCHCDSCRRAAGAAFVTWIGQANGLWSLTGKAIRSYASSAGRTRGFCGTCGAPLFYKSTDYPDETHFYAALLDDPNAVTPTDVYFEHEKLAWADLSHDLTPKKLP